MSWGKGNKHDPTDIALSIVSAPELFAPFFDVVIAGYNTEEIESGDKSDCKAKEKELKAQGIKCRTSETPYGWRVISRR